MNQVQLLGRLAKDPIVNNTSSTAVARFTVAVDRIPDKSGNKSADFISCVSFGKTAEFVQKYFQKGKPISLSGRIQTGSYEKNGEKIYTTDVVAERVEFVPGAGGGSSAEPKDPEGQNDSSGNGWGIGVTMDDIPF